MELSVAFMLALIEGAALGLLVRRLLGPRVRLGWAEAVVSGIAGSALGALLVSAILGYTRERWAAVVLAGAASTVLVMLVVGYFTRQPRLTVDDLVAAGESARVEFKSTARCNLHTGQRDDKIELIIAKTVAAFANAAGGDLMIGVDDQGQPVGLADDLKFMKSPDLDRFELWLHDHLTKCLGAPATTHVAVTFPPLNGQTVCHMRVTPSNRPVFVTVGKGQPAQMWVRVGNSTRQLPVDEALSYAADRWGRRRLR